MTSNEVQDRIVKAYDSMPRKRWDLFEAYCSANDIPTSLVSFVEYLLVCAERAELGRVEARGQDMETALEMWAEATLLEHIIEEHAPSVDYAGACERQMQLLRLKARQLLKLPPPIGRGRDDAPAQEQER